MRSIDKGQEPECLARARAAGLSEWDATVCDSPEGRHSNALREALVHSQHGLCAYCMGRIKPHGYRPDLHSRGGMKIEHWNPRSGPNGMETMYEWSNLLGVCGGEWQGSSGLVAHCDTSRGNHKLWVNPGTTSSPTAESAFYFSRTPPPDVAEPRQGIWIHPRGDRPDGAEPNASTDIHCLNLNAPHLARNRNQAIQQIRKRLAVLSRKRGQAAVRSHLRNLVSAATSPGDRPPYAPLVEHYAASHLTR